MRSRTGWEPQAAPKSSGGEGRREDCPLETAGRLGPREHNRRVCCVGGCVHEKIKIAARLWSGRQAYETSKCQTSNICSVSRHGARLRPGTSGTPFHRAPAARPRPQRLQQCLLAVLGHSILENLIKALVFFLEKHTRMCTLPWGHGGSHPPPCDLSRPQIKTTSSLAFLPPTPNCPSGPFSIYSHWGRHCSHHSFPRPKHTLYFPTFEPGVRVPEVPFRCPGGRSWVPGPRTGTARQ